MSEKPEVIQRKWAFDNDDKKHAYLKYLIDLEIAGVLFWDISMGEYRQVMDLPHRSARGDLIPIIPGYKIVAYKLPAFKGGLTWLHFDGRIIEPPGHCAGKYFILEPIAEEKSEPETEIVECAVYAGQRREPHFSDHDYVRDLCSAASLPNFRGYKVEKVWDAEENVDVVDETYTDLFMPYWTMRHDDVTYAALELIAATGYRVTHVYLEVEA